LKKITALLFAFCIVLIPVLECVCCEDNLESTSCCSTQSTKNYPCDVHPCLHSLNDLLIVESSEPASQNSSLDKQISSFHFEKSDCKTTTNGSISKAYIGLRRHLLFSVIIV
jgi:hypothetical protein